MRSSGSLASVRRLNSVARAMWYMVERTDDQPRTGSATYCSAVSLRQASKTLVLAQRSYANNATTSPCTVISPVCCKGWFGLETLNVPDSSFSRIQPLVARSHHPLNSYGYETTCERLIMH